MPQDDKFKCALGWQVQVCGEEVAMVKGMESWVLAYVLNALWQVPLVFAAAWVAARAVRRRDVALEHQIWTCALVLEAVLPACSMRLDAVLRSLSLLSAGVPAVHGATVSVVVGAGQVQGGLRMTTLWQEAAVLLYVSVVLYFVVRLMIVVHRTLRLRATAEAITLEGEARASFERMGRVFGVRVVAVVASADVCGPVVLGVWRRMLMLPCDLLPGVSDEDFAAAMAHEFAHLRRQDFAKNLLYEVLSLPVTFHPLLWLTRARVAATREALCDALAADAVQGRQQYARSLLRLASNFSERTRSTATHAIGIFDANSFKNFEERVMNLTEKQMEVRGVRRVAVAALVVVLGFGACASALALRLQVAAPVQQSAGHTLAPPAPFTLTVPPAANGTPTQVVFVEIPAAKAGGVAAPVRILTPTSVAADQTVSAVRFPAAVSHDANAETTQIPAGVMAGQVQSRVNPVYPQEAKDAKISGSVVLKAVIAKDGSIENLQVVSGPELLVPSAMDAVRQWVYKPYLLNGEPTEVETTITVNYTLNQ